MRRHETFNNASECEPLTYRHKSLPKVNGNYRKDRLAEAASQIEQLNVAFRNIRQVSGLSLVVSTIIIQNINKQASGLSRDGETHAAGGMTTLSLDCSLVIVRRDLIIKCFVF